MNKKIGVVILNYLAFQESIDITRQFLGLPQNNIDLHIVVVDNKSANESFKRISSAFASNSQVSVAQTESNLGFANGNNFGYTELVKHFNPDYVIFSNSDIVLKDDGLFDWIVDTDMRYNFGILGPSVYSLRGDFHQNPIPNRNTDLEWNKKQIKVLQMRKNKLKFVSVFPLLLTIKSKIKGLRNKSAQPKDWGDYTRFTTDQTLHGSFLVMSQRYLSKFETPFDPGTFLYMEEDLLKLRCMRKKIKMVYSPDYEVNHKQAVSTVKVNSSEIKRKLIRTDNEMNSLRRYIEVLEEDNA